MDCMEGLLQLPNGCVDMILCDLPYGVTQCNWDTIIPIDRLWSEYKRVIKPNGAIVLTAVEPFASQLRLSNISMYKYDWIWYKVKGTGFLNARKQPLRSHEVICIFYAKQCTYNPQKTTGHFRKTSIRRNHLQTDVYGSMNKDYRYDSTERYPSSILTFSTDTENSSIHPTQKPVALFEYLIRTYTNPGDIILDNCMGSGTTAVACMAEKRQFIGFEINKDYCTAANKRIREFKSQLKIF